MERRTFFKKLLFPPLWLLLLLVLLSAAALTAVFVQGLTESPIAYVSYVLSFYTLCVLTLYCSMVLPKQYQRLRQSTAKLPLLHRYMTDALFRTHISLYAALTVNLLYAGANLLSWALYHSMWFVVLAVYYVILSVMRFLLVRYVHSHKLGENRLGELHRAQLCSAILLLLNFVLTGAVMMILYQNKGFSYHGILIYVMALYTFYITIHAIVNLVKYRKYRSPVMTTSKVISLSAALVSVLALETAMLSQFGMDMTAENKWLMIALTGAGISVVVIILSIYMIVKTAKEIKEIENNGRE